MINYIDLLTITEIKILSPILKYVNNDDITPIIRVTQNRWIKQILGTNLYYDLMNKKVLNTLNNDESELIDNYIKPCEAWYIAMNVSRLNSIKITNKGVTKQFSENSQAADLQDINAATTFCKGEADSLAEDLRGYLMDNKLIFPKYSERLFTNEEVPPADSNEFGGIFLDFD